MSQFKTIDQLIIKDTELVCRSQTRRSYQKAHFKQGDLDGACGAYSIAMVLNILSVFDAEELYSDNAIDKRTCEWKLIEALHSYGLYRDGLTLEEVQVILHKYNRYIRTEEYDITHEESEDVNYIRTNIDNNIPMIAGISYNKYDGHWVVIIGYSTDNKGNVENLLILDPGVNSPKVCCWNAMLSVKREKNKKYGYTYFSDNVTKVNFDELVAVFPK